MALPVVKVGKAVKLALYKVVGAATFGQFTPFRLSQATLITLSVEVSLSSFRVSASGVPIVGVKGLDNTPGLAKSTKLSLEES